jgi:hypothetical protein
MNYSRHPSLELNDDLDGLATPTTNECDRTPRPWDANEAARPSPANIDSSDDDDDQRRRHETEGILLP